LLDQAVKLIVDVSKAMTVSVNVSVGLIDFVRMRPALLYVKLVVRPAGSLSVRT
jgi:hypothetical protein